MEIKNFFVQDQAGNVVPSPTIYVYSPGTQDLISGLKDVFGADLANPFTGSTMGQVSFGAPDGSYDVRATGSGRDFTMRIRFIDAVDYETKLTDAKKRANHTGTQAMATVDGLAEALESAKSRANHTGTQAMTTVDGLAAALTAARARGNHTGTQAISTVSNLQASLDAKAGFTIVAPYPGAAPRTFAGKLAERVSVKDFGNPDLIGIGQHIPLSILYPTLAAAQADYPFVTSLSDNLDYAAFQAACNAVEGNQGLVEVPAGTYVKSKCVLVPSGIAIIGTAPNGCVFSNQYLGLDDYHFRNKNAAAFVGNVFRDVTALYGKGFLYANVSGAESSVSKLEFHNVNTTGMSETDLRFSRLETTLMNKCNLMSGGNLHRIHVDAFPCNSNVLLDTRMVDAGGAIYINGGENFLMLGGSIEGGGTAGGKAIELNTGGSYIKNIVFDNVYLENISRYLLKCPSVAEGILFRAIHVTGSADYLGTGGFIAPEFDTGDAIIGMDNCDFAAGFADLMTQAPKRAVLTGRNKNVLGDSSYIYRHWDRTSGKVSTPRKVFVAPGVAEFPAFKFTRANASGGANNHVLLTGVWTIRVLGFLAEGGAPAHRVFRKLVTVTAYADGNIGATADDMPGHDGTGGAFTASIGASTSPLSLSLTLAVAGLNGAGQNSLSQSFEYEQHSYSDKGAFLVEAI